MNQETIRRVENILSGAYLQYILYKDGLTKSASFTKSQYDAELRRKIAFYIKTSLSRFVKDSKWEGSIDEINIHRNTVSINFTNHLPRYYACPAGLIIKGFEFVWKENFALTDSKDKSYLNFSIDNNYIDIGIREQFLKNYYPFQKDDEGNFIKHEKILHDRHVIAKNQLIDLKPIIEPALDFMHNMVSKIYDTYGGLNEDYRWSLKDIFFLMKGYEAKGHNALNPNNQWAMEPLRNIRSAIFGIERLSVDHDIKLEEIIYDGPNSILDSINGAWCWRADKNEEKLTAFNDCASWCISVLENLRERFGVKVDE